jgi:hypothetical protein
MGLFDRALATIEENKQRVENGLVNSIPHNFIRFRDELPGIERKQYYLITANQKVGKSQITDELFVHAPIRYAFHNQDKIRVKIFYFTLELPNEQKAMQIMSNILWNMTDYRIRVAPKDLRSTNIDKPLPGNVLELLSSREYREIYDFYENHIEFISDIRNPYGIYKFMKDYALANGVMHKKTISYTDKKTGDLIEREVDDFYEPHDKEEQVIVITDHLSCLTPEKSGSLRDAIIKFSREYCIDLRNNYKQTIVNVIQQALAQESTENMKMGQLKPSAAGIGDAKVVVQDCDYLLGLYSPYRHGIETYERYDIKLFKDNIRFLEIIAGREGGGGNICPLLFDGGVNHFSELPLPNDHVGLAKTRKLLERMQSSRIEQEINY